MGMLDNKLLLSHFSWTRANTQELYAHAMDADVLGYKPKYLIENPAENHNLLYQFQCILTSTNTHFRRLLHADIVRFGIYVKSGVETQKQDIQPSIIAQLLEEQVAEAKHIFEVHAADTNLASTFLTISEHECLHQGQLITMFRETNTEFPLKFKHAWNL